MKLILCLYFLTLIHCKIIPNGLWYDQSLTRYNLYLQNGKILGYYEEYGEYKHNSLSGRYSNNGNSTSLSFEDSYLPHYYWNAIYNSNNFYGYKTDTYGKTVIINFIKANNYVNGVWYDQYSTRYNFYLISHKISGYYDELNNSTFYSIIGKYINESSYTTLYFENSQYRWVGVYHWGDSSFYANRTNNNGSEILLHISKSW